PRDSRQPKRVMPGSPRLTNTKALGIAAYWPTDAPRRDQGSTESRPTELGLCLDVHHRTSWMRRPWNGPHVVSYKWPVDLKTTLSLAVGPEARITLSTDRLTPPPPESMFYWTSHLIDCRN